MQSDGTNEEIDMHVPSAVFFEFKKFGYRAGSIFGFIVSLGAFGITLSLIAKLPILKEAITLQHAQPIFIAIGVSCIGIWSYFRLERDRKLLIRQRDVTVEV